MNRKYEWLAGRADLNTVFCWYCLLFGKDRDTVSEPRPDSSIYKTLLNLLPVSYTHLDVYKRQKADRIIVN